jgi:ATP-dependent DNA helicase RecG
MDCALSKSEISEKLGQKAISGELNKRVRSLRSGGLIAYTLPDKPRSRLQKYQLTEQGRAWLFDQEAD